MKNATRKKRQHDPRGSAIRAALKAFGPTGGATYLSRKRRLARLLTVEDVHRAARRRLPRVITEFLDGGAESEATVAANRSAWGEVKLMPRVLVDVRERDLETTVLGRSVSLPVLLSPAGLARLAHPEGEVATARAAQNHGTVMALSTSASSSIEEVGDVGEASWFQLYVWGDRNLTTSLLERARRSGYEALCVTVDVPIVGQRERDLRNGMTVPPRLRPRSLLDASWRVPWWWGFFSNSEVTFENFRGVAGAQNDDSATIQEFVNRKLVDPSVTWRELAWLREQWEGPLVLKGIMSPEDARLAVDHGASGLVVSNHGGRQLDEAPGTAHVLSDIVDAVGKELEIYVDGGIRRGTDVVKALAMGARAVMIGRPWFWGLATGGQAGVERVLEILRLEIDRTLALIGCPRVTELDRTWLRPAGGAAREILLPGAPNNGDRDWGIHRKGELT